MALIFENLSECPLCNKVLDNSKPFRAISPLISNVKDPLFVFSDEGVHIDCLNNSPLKEKLLYHLECYEKRFPPTDAKCIVDGQRISDPRNLISFGLLTSNESEELYQFNYVTINKNNLGKWERKGEFISTVERFINDGKWESLNDFNYLKYLIEKLA